MKKAILGFFFLAALFWPDVTRAQGTSQWVTLVANYDLDGAAASGTAVHSADAIVDSTSFTIDAQPDTPRPLIVTVVDADSSVTCTLTVVGKLADGTSITATADLGGGSGTKSLSTAYNWASVTSSSVGVCTGEGGADTVALGTTGNPPIQYFSAYGDEVRNGYKRKGVFEWFPPRNPKIAIASSSTTLSCTASAACFYGIDVGDLLLFNINGEPHEFVVVTNADDDTVTVDHAPIATFSSTQYLAGFKKQYRGPDTYDGIIPMRNFAGGTATFVFIGTQVGNNSHSFVECRMEGAATAWVQMDTDAFTTAANVISTVDLRTTAWDYCRAGFQFDTNDADGDSGAELEKITIQFSGTFGAR